MRCVLLVLVAAIATPAVAQRTKTVLPPAPRGVDYVETVCIGGIGARYDQVRVLATGQVAKASRPLPDPAYARASRAEVRRIWRALDVAQFERRVATPEKLHVMDGIDCSITRNSGGTTHTVTLIQQMRGNPRYSDLTAVIDDVNALGRRATGPIMRPATDR